MPDQSTSQSSVGPQQSKVPAIRSFEFDAKSIGAIKSSVNQFRGTVSLPIDLLTLEGRPGLDVKVSLLYQSNVQRQVDTWNVDSPTGIVGLGWQMPFEFITVDKNGNGSPSSDRCFLVSGGSASPMVKVDETAQGQWRFELRNFQFWDIRYDPSTQVWRITKEDGSVYAYGAEDPAANAVQHGVGWGNWLGSSSRLDGQATYPVSWNLCSITSVLGHRVSYAYDNVDFAVGDRDGQRFTQASYVKRIVDSLGRIVTFDYKEKYGRRNPSPQNIVEYQAAHGGRPEPNAYQDRYETRYLDTVTVANADGEILYGLQLTFDFLNFAATTDPRRSLLWKRCLRSVFQWSPDGQALPSLLFDYYQGERDVNRGALKKVTYPAGGEATFTYKENVLDAPKRVEVANPLPGSRPGVWQGDDYVVFTFASSQGMRVLVYSWNGRWVSQDVTPSTLSTLAVDADSVWVAPAGEFFAVSVRDAAGSRDLLYLFRPDATGFGQWQLDPAGERRLPLSADAGASTFIAGTDYVVAANPAYTGAAFQGFSWDWMQGAWTSPAVLPSSADARAATGFSLAAFGNYYAVAFYFQDQRQGRFQTLYRDAQGAWHAGATWTNGDLDVASAEGRLLFNWSPQPGYAVATYVTGSDRDTLRYSLRVFQLDERFQALNASDPKVVDLETTLPNDEPRFDVFLTRAAAAFVNNNPLNLRNEGGDQEVRATANWLRRDFQLAAGTKVAFAAGDDVSVATQDGGSGNQLLIFDPNQPGAAAWSVQSNVDQQGRWPTVAGRYLTVGRRIYFREDDGTWRALGTELNNLQDEESVQNRAPSYIAYQDRDDASARSYLVTLANGEAAAPVELPGGPQKVAVPRQEATPGSTLAGARSLVTYPSSESFAGATRFSLYNVDDGNLSDFEVDYPVAAIEIANPFDPATSFAQSFFYANSSQSQIAYDPANGLAQYPKVITVAGVKSTAQTPPSAQPQGRSEFFYSNGLSPQADLRYPVGTIYNYESILNGVLLGQKDYDSANRLVGNQLNYWQVYTDNAAENRRLWGAYARPVRTTVTRDGISEDSRSGFDPKTGLEAWREQSYRDATGKQKRLRDEVLYAWQVPEYAAVFTARHYLSAEARRDRCAVDAASGAKTYFESRAVTWKDWSGGGRAVAEATADAHLARWQVYQWKAETAQPEFPFGSGDRSGWVRLSEVRRRTEPDYLIAEQVDTNGTPSSYLYDKHQRYLVASFPGASRDGGEASYWGMEPYESDAGWQLGSGATFEPAGGTAVDAHSGERCVSLAPGSGGNAGLSHSFRPQRAGSYGFSAWVKTAAGFDAARGKARFRITVGSAAPLDVDFPAAAEGEWVHLAARFEVAAGATVQIVGENLNDRSAVRVDDLIFAPWSCTWSATPYDTHLWLPATRLEANGEASRLVYDDFGRIVLATNAADRLSEVTGPYQSRQGNEGTYSVADPDHTSVLRPAEGGSLSTFSRGDQWQQAWAPAPGGVWQVSDQRLTQKQPATAGTLTLRQAEQRLGYTVAARLTPTEAVTAPMGIHVGDRLTVQWDPGQGVWKLQDGDTAAGKAATTSPATPVYFRVPAERCAGALDAALADNRVSEELRREFAVAGLHLRADAELRAVDGVADDGGRWDLEVPGALHRFELRRQGDELEVRRLGGAWSLLVRERTLLFWVDGKLIFSHVADAPLTGAPQLFFATRVALSALAAGLAPAAAVSFTDASGSPLQEQALEGERAVVSQVLTDDQGRAAVSTKPAYVAAADSPLLQYCQDFARLDWASGIMTGRVARAYPGDGGYPYSRDVFEASPLGRMVERGLPGTDFRVGAHSTHYAYGSNDGSLGLPASSYTRESVTDPNGNVSYQLSTVLGQVVYKVSVRQGEGESGDVRSFSRFDDAGNPVELRLPNYFQPPQGSTPDDWASIQTFDWAGRLLTTRTGRQGTTEMVYSPSGELRFMQEPQGAADGTYTYWKYDDLGRLLETGYVAGSFDRATLQKHADDNPDWPPTPPTWRRKFSWDGDLPAQRSVGRVQRTEANSGDAGSVDVGESYDFNVFGNTLRVERTAAGFEGSQRVDYGFDDAGNLLYTLYPQPSTGERWQIHYRYDALRRVQDMAEQADFSAPLVSYTYDPDGRPKSEVLRPGSAAAVTRSFGFNSPLWPTSLRDRRADDGAVFTEELSYTRGGFGGAGYYDGLIAAADYPAAGGVDAYGFRYSYSSLGEVRNAESAQQPQWNLGVQKPVTYDDDGNFTSAARGGGQRRYDYVAGTQRVHQVVDPASGAVLAGYDYDDNGSVVSSRTAASPFAAAHDLAFTYDPGIHRVTRVDQADGPDLRLRYGGNGERVVKETWDGSRRTGRKLYVRGTNSFPLYERSVAEADGASTEGTTVESCYAFGPGGLVAMRRGGEVYGVLKDHLGSVRRVLSPSGAVVATYDYLTFGSVARKSEPEEGFIPYLFTGQEWDGEIGLYNYRARFYSSEIGRFLDVDPARQFFSPYVYASNNPVLYVDPTGTFSLKSLFSAIAGVIIGAVEILIGVVVDIVAGVLEVVTGGLSTPASVALAALAGTFYGAGASSILYSVVNVQSFDWKEYGIQMGIGAVAGALSFGIGAFGSAVAEGATGVKAAVEAGQQVSRLAKAANTLIDTGFTAAGGFVSGVASAGISDAAHNVNPGFDLVEGGLWSAVSFGLGKAIPGPSYKAGWGNLGKRVLINVGKKEAIGVSLNTTRNLVEGNPLDQGLLNTVASGALWGTLGSLQAKTATQKALDFSNILDGVDFS